MKAMSEAQKSHYVGKAAHDLRSGLHTFFAQHRGGSAPSTKKTSSIKQLESLAHGIRVADAKPIGGYHKQSVEADPARDKADAFHAFIREAERMFQDWASKTMRLESIKMKVDGLIQGLDKEAYDDMPKKVTDQYQSLKRDLHEAIRVLGEAQADGMKEGVYQDFKEDYSLTNPVPSKIRMAIRTTESLFLAEAEKYQDLGDTKAFIGQLIEGVSARVRSMSETADRPMSESLKTRYGELLCKMHDAVKLIDKAMQSGMKRGFLDQLLKEASADARGAYGQASPGKGEETPEPPKRRM